MFRKVRMSAGAIALVGVFALTLTACSGAGGGTASPSASADAEPQAGGTAVVGALSEMPGFDPVRLVALGTGIERAAQVMDTLMYRNDITGEVTPKLAKSLESDDGKIWVLTLREGVDFTDGTPLDAAAVVFNLDRHIAPDSKSSAKSMLSGIQAMEATGDLEVTITLAEPSGSFPLALTGSSPAGLIGSPAALANPDEFNENPVGAGPFKFKSWMRDSELDLVRNDDYFVKGQPYLDGVTYQVLPDPQGRIDAVMSGGVILAQVSGSGWASVEANKSLITVASPAGGQALVPNSSKGPGSDVRIREAIGLATDPKVANSVIFPGSTLWNLDRDCIPFPESSPACLKGSSPTPDIEKAKELVAEYVAEGNSNVIDFSAPAASDEVSYYASAMSEIGLDVKIRIADAAAWLQDTATGNYDVIYGVNGSSGYPTQWRYMYSGGFNWGRVVNPDLDEALLRARDELKLEDRNKAWQDVSEVVKRDSILFWQTPFASATSYSTKLHLGSDEFPYEGTLMIYLGDAWLDQ